MPSKAPYKRIKGKPVLRKSVVLSLDILGFKNLSRHTKPALLLTRLWSAIRTAMPKSFRMTPRSMCAVKAYSDNVLIAWPVLGDGEWELGSTVANAAIYQAELIRAGFFCRGALTIGDIYVDDLIAFGPALIEAHELEESVAEFPRVVLSRVALIEARQHLSYYGDRPHAPQDTFLLFDRDGECFINYLAADLAWGTPTAHAVLQNRVLPHRERVIRELEKAAENERVHRKYRWVSSYHNYFCRRFAPGAPMAKIEPSRFRRPFFGFVETINHLKRKSTPGRR